MCEVKIIFHLKKQYLKVHQHHVSNQSIFIKKLGLKKLGGKLRGSSSISKPKIFEHFETLVISFSGLRASSILQLRFLLVKGSSSSSFTVILIPVFLSFCCFSLSTGIVCSSSLTTRPWASSVRKRNKSHVNIIEETYASSYIQQTLEVQGLCTT